MKRNSSQNTYYSLRPNRLAQLNAVFFICLVAAVLLGCASTDPIDRLVKKVSSDPWFTSGLYMPIHLPDTASPEQVVARALNVAPTNLMVIEVKRVTISYGNQIKIDPKSTEYVAVFVGTKPVYTVVFIQYRPDKYAPGWWWRAYDVK
jgi:hypothetical protein